MEKDILSVIKFEPPSDFDWLFYRFEKSDFNSSSKLVVSQGQRAICVHLGKIQGEFKPGITLLNTENYPFLKKLVKKVHSGDDAFTFEIYFVNMTIKTTREWGTKKPLLTKDPETGLLVHARGYGSYNFRLVDPQFLLQMMIGSFDEGGMVPFSKIQSDFDDKIQESIQLVLGDILINQKTSVLELSLKTKVFSNGMKEEISEYFRKYGFELIDFNTSSLSILGEDIEAYKKKKEYDVLGTSHLTERQLNISETWAKNEGTAGGIASAGMGLGIGLNAANSFMNSNVSNPTNVKENDTKIICPNCNSVIPLTSKFCPECGKSLSHKCPKCGADVSLGMKFCPECGNKIGG